MIGYSDVSQPSERCESGPSNIKSERLEISGRSLATLIMGSLILSTKRFATRPEQGVPPDPRPRFSELAAYHKITVEEVEMQADGLLGDLFGFYVEGKAWKPTTTAGSRSNPSLLLNEDIVLCILGLNHLKSEQCSNQEQQQNYKFLLLHCMPCSFGMDQLVESSANVKLWFQEYMVSPVHTYCIPSISHM